MMRTQTLTARAARRERPLAADGSEATNQFLDLAGRELDRAYRLAGLLLGDRAEAEDATQDALLRAWHRRDSLRDPGQFQAWFDRILVNGCRDRLRRRRSVRFIALDGAGDPASAADPFRSIADRDEVLRVVARLGDDERLVVILHYWADLTLVDVAERTGWPLGTVKSRLHRALGRLAVGLDTDIGTAEGRRP
jgi:RNA polymerase sigma-70 factor (ECF subfamily)